MICYDRGPVVVALGCTVPNGTGPCGYVLFLPMRCPYGTGAAAWHPVHHFVMAVVWWLLH